MPPLVGLGAAAVVGLLTLALAPLADLSSGFRPLGGGRLAALLTRRDRPQVTAGETVSARRRWMPLEEAVLYEVVEGMAARLQAGQVADQALDGAVRELEGPLGRDLRHAVRRHQRGTPLAAALVEVRGPAHVLRQLGETLAIVEETGGHLGTALGHILQGFRERRRLVGILRIRTAEARYALQLMAILPLLLVLYLVGAHPHVLVPLWSEATGRLSSAYALGSWASGIWLMRGLVLPERYL